MHLDPDFTSLTYGDTDQRGKDIARFMRGDVIYRVDEVVGIDSFDPDRWSACVSSW